MSHDSEPNNNKPTSGDEAKQLKPQQRIALKKISRARTRLIVCFWTLPVYIIGIWALLNNGSSIDLFMFIYMALYAGFALDMSMRRCPLCREQFFVKSILLNLLTHQCMHCGVSFDVDAEWK